MSLDIRMQFLEEVLHGIEDGQFSITVKTSSWGELWITCNDQTACRQALRDVFTKLIIAARRDDREINRQFSTKADYPVRFEHKVHLEDIIDDMEDD